ncbi:MAG: outer membrane protein assembly factor BamD [Nitrospiraceae bacterium]|nr:outer membrane protein assembly factor BamD [Nitrospiraceae bacterium]
MRRRVFQVGLVAGLLCVLSFSAVAQWTWTPQTGRWINLKNLPKETPELQVEYARSLLLEGDLKKAIRETNKFDSFYGDTDMADRNQFVRGEIRMAQDKPLAASQEFQLVVSSYPDTSLYGDVIAKQYEIGDSLYEKGQAKLDKRWRMFRKRPFKQAIQVYSLVIDSQPFTDEAAEAQYKVGLCHHTREEYVEAAYEYRRVIEDYTGSDWVDDASYGLATCYSDASLPPAYDQEPSRLAIDAIDEFTARYEGDDRVAELKEKRVVMRENIAQQRLQTAQFYEKRRNFKAARIYYKVVAENFEDTATAQTALQWLADNPDPEMSPSERVLQAKRVS